MPNRFSIYTEGVETYEAVLLKQSSVMSLHLTVTLETQVPLAA